MNILTFSSGANFLWDRSFTEWDRIKDRNGGENKDKSLGIKPSFMFNPKVKYHTRYLDQTSIKY